MQIYNASEYSSYEEAKKFGAVYKTASDLQLDNTSKLDQLEVIGTVLEMLGNKDLEVAVIFDDEKPVK